MFISNLWRLGASQPTPPVSPIRACTSVYHVHCRVLIRSRQSLQNHIRFSPTMKCHRKQQIKLCTRRVHDIQVKLIFCNVTEANYQNTLNKSKQCTRRVHEVKVKLFFCNVTKANHESLMIDSKQMYQDLGEYTWFMEGKLFFCNVTKALMGLVQVRTKWCKVGEFNQKASICLQPSKLQRKRRWITMVWVGYYLG